MELSNEDKKRYAKRLILSRLRILSNHGFYGMLLMHISFALNESVNKCSTDGKNIEFSPKFLETINDNELDFVLMHEIMHIVLRHIFRDDDKDIETFNKAADIVVNSNILYENDMDLSSITVLGKECIHKLKNGDEGYKYTTEEVYNNLYLYVKDKNNKIEDNSSDSENGSDVTNKSTESNNSSNKQKSNNQSNDLDANNDSNSNGESKSNSSKGETFDDHSLWNDSKKDKMLEDEWIKNFEEVCETLLIRDPINTYGTIPKFAMRMFEELKYPKLDWRVLLNNFIQEEVVDYSFTPPDKRFDESEFFLPDFNEKDEFVKNVLFMIDTSGSMSDDLITTVYSEVKGALYQFNGKLQGYLGFFDAKVVEPKPFSNEDELKIIRPVGGGGTRFDIIFEYVNKNMTEEITSIIILTDGYAPFPKEESSNGIPVLWVIVNDDVIPPWGKIARI